ncbi:ABC transporter substrate-binding protein [Mammaliicoccus sciuri]
MIKQNQRLQLVNPKKSNDGKTWTFKLREDAKWSNGGSYYCT